MSSALGGLALPEQGTMNDVAIVKEGWLHKRGQCPWGWARGRGLSGGVGRFGPAGPVAAWLGPSGGRATAASLPAFLEGSEDTGARPRPGSPAARGAARGLLRAGQSYLAWPGARLGPGLWGGVGRGGVPHQPGAWPGCVCAGAASRPSPVQPRLSACSEPCARGGPWRGLVRGEMRPWPLGRSPLPRSPLWFGGGEWGVDRLHVQLSPGECPPPAPGRGLTTPLPLPPDLLLPRLWQACWLPGTPCACPQLRA